MTSSEQGRKKKIFFPFPEKGGSKNKCAFPTFVTNIFSSIIPECVIFTCASFSPPDKGICVSKLCSNRNQSYVKNVYALIQVFLFFWTARKKIFFFLLHYMHFPSWSIIHRWKWEGARRGICIYCMHLAAGRNSFSEEKGGKKPKINFLTSS